jgi:hypothetical protein
MAPMPPQVIAWPRSRQFKVDVVAAQHRLGLLRPPAFCIQAARDSLLAVAQDLGIGSVHSKCHFSLGLVSLITSQQTQDGRAFRAFFFQSGV